MRKQILALIIAPLLMVFLSGCTDWFAQAGGVSSGVILKSFSPDMPEIFSGDDVTFTLNVENVGGEAAANVRATLFGLGSDWSGADWDGAANSGILKTVTGTLERSEPELKIPGGTGDMQWDLVAPSGLKTDNTYVAGVRMKYDYKTTALANVKVYSNAYLKTIPDQADAIMKSSGIDSFTLTQSPISVELAGLARPVIYKGTGQTATVTILITNVGQGYPYETSESDMTVDVLGVTVNGDACNTAPPVTAKLPRSGAKAITCTFNVPSVTSYTTIPLEVKLGYTYFLDGSASIKVLKAIGGTEGAGGAGATGTSITGFGVDVPSASAGTIVTFYGYLMAGSTPVIGATVTINNYNTNAVLASRTTSTAGEFLIPYTLPAAGTFTVNARYAGSSSYSSSQSGTIDITST